MQDNFILSEEEKDLAIKMGIDPNNPEFVEYKKECQDLHHKLYSKICAQTGLNYEYVIEQVNNFGLNKEVDGVVYHAMMEGLSEWKKKLT